MRSPSATSGPSQLRNSASAKGLPGTVTLPFGPVTVVPTLGRYVTVISPRSFTSPMAGEIRSRSFSSAARSCPFEFLRKPSRNASMIEPWSTPRTNTIRTSLGSSAATMAPASEDRAGR